jgi:glycosyltransferase involved in cell wall biosynthesis
VSRPTGFDAADAPEKRFLGAQKAGVSDLAVDPVDASGGGAVSLSVIMPTVSWEGCFEPCVRAAIEHSAARGGGGAEILVVFDGVGGPPPRWLPDAGVKVFVTGTCGGPAHARNLGAAEASGNVLLFLDADVEIAADALERVRAAFATTPDLVALFGSYDDAPACHGVVSQFRNLLHHHTHMSHPGRAASFWSGCGAIRTAAFFDVGGFDDDFRHPSVEDIELGLRVQAAGGRILLDPAIQCKHHKSWSLRSMVMNDIFRRAVPWTRLILENHDLPVTLNLDWGNRLCGAAALFSALLLPLSIAIGSRWPLPALPVVLLAMAWMHLDFYQLCLRRRGVLFALAAFALHWLFYLYSTLTFAAVVIGSTVSLWLGRLPRPRLFSPPPETSNPSRN